MSKDIYKFKKKKKTRKENIQTLLQYFVMKLVNHG